MLRLAELLSARAGGAQAFFCSSGAEANEAALKVARKTTGRTRLVALEESFHGRTLGALSVTGQPGKWEGFGPLVPGVSFARPNDVESLESAVSPGAELAAIVLEPVLGEGGIVPLEPGFVQAAAEIAREVGALLWLDEVQTGVGRTGTFFAYEQLGIEPDLVTLAKGLGNGLPIGALLARSGAADAIGPGDHGATFGGNPVASAAACAVVEAIDDALLANVVERGAQLTAGLEALPGVTEVRGRGLMVAAALDREVGPVVDACRDEGLLVLTAGPPPGVLRLLPPLVVGEDGGRAGARDPSRRARVSGNRVRQQAILRLVRDRAISTQSALVDALREEGHDVVQTTVSRDIHDLGLVKVRAPSGRLVYAAPGADDADRRHAIGVALRRYATSVERAGPLVVVATPSGYASALAQAIDEGHHAGIAGTIAGDNTIFVAPREGTSVTALATELRGHLERD